MNAKTSYIVLGVTVAAVSVLMIVFALSGKPSNQAYGAYRMSGDQTSNSSSSAMNVNNANMGNGPYVGRAWGLIGSIQNDNNGNPAWVATGYWLMRINPQPENSTATPVVLLRSTFEMVKLDGTARHMHMISDFSLISMSDTGNVTSFNGTSTITLKDGAHSNVQTSIKVMNHNVIAIWFDPQATGSHFGNTPIFGTTAKLNDAYHSIVHSKMAMKGSM